MKGVNDQNENVINFFKEFEALCDRYEVRVIRYYSSRLVGGGGMVVDFCSGEEQEFEYTGDGKMTLL